MINEGGENKDNIFIGDITEELVRDFIAWGLGRGRKTDTVEKYLEAISKICRQATDDGLLPQAVTTSIANIEVEGSLNDDECETIKYMTLEEIGKLVRIDHSRLSQRQLDYLDIILFSIYACGLRISDIITLRWNNIDFEKRLIRKKVMKTRRNIKIHLGNDAMEILTRWKGRHEVFVFGLLDPNFDLTDEEKLKNRRNSITTTINKSLEKISKIAQLDKKVTTHYARHSFGVLALEQGTPTTMISKLMGHKTTYVTEDVYADYLPGSKKETVNKLKFYS